MLKLKKNDTVEVIKGRDRGKKGRVLAVFPATGRALVESINLVKKHMRKTQQDQQGGIIAIESPISIANIALFCKNCNQDVRSGIAVLKDGTKSRICKKCKGTL